ncbi:MAG: response regulator, partial [Candidatus Krumholzibacteria bacterium]|nr:response regulator [Candidatus Krumholzibacteria bacterium]
MKGNVLIIDDEAEIRRSLTVGLTQEDYSVVACPDGISAIHELNNAREKGIAYDYLITDIFMPDIDGLKILKVIKSQYPDLPVLVITGFGDVSLQLTALSEYNTGYLDKPFEIQDLVKALEELTPSSTAKEVAGEKPEAVDLGMRESVSAYLTIRITDTDKSMDIFRTLYKMEGVQSCEAVRGDFDIIVLGRASSQDEMKALFDRISVIDGVEIISMS